MPLTFTDHPNMQCADCGYEFRKNDSFIYSDDTAKIVCASAKNCLRRQRTASERMPSNPTFDEMAERVAHRLKEDVFTHMMMASESESYLRALWERSYEKRDGRYRTITDPWGPQR